MLQSTDRMRDCRPMVLSTLIEGWLSRSQSQAEKRHYGHRCSVRPQRVDMYPWTGPDPNLPPPDPGQRSVQHGHGPDEPTGSPRYPAVGGPGAGDYGGDGPQLVRSRFSRSSSSLEQVPEEIGNNSCQDAELMPPTSCSIRRARYHIITSLFTSYTYNQEHSESANLRRRQNFNRK